MAVGYPIGQFRYKEFPSLQKVLLYGALLEKYEKASWFFFFFLLMINTLLGKQSTTHKVGDNQSRAYMFWNVNCFTRRPLHGHVSVLAQRTLKQMLSKYSPQGQILTTTWLCKWSFIETQPYALMYVSSMASLTLQQQRWVVAHRACMACKM